MLRIPTQMFAPLEPFLRFVTTNNIETSSLNQNRRLRSIDDGARSANRKSRTGYGYSTRGANRPGDLSDLGNLSFTRTLSYPCDLIVRLIQNLFHVQIRGVIFGQSIPMHTHIFLQMEQLIYFRSIKTLPVPGIIKSHQAK